MVAIFTDFHHSRNGRILEGQSYQVICCSGISIDLLNAVARDLNFEYDLYLVADGLFGVPRNGRWDGITADLMSGAADMTFTAFSVTSSRVKVRFLFTSFSFNKFKYFTTFSFSKFKHFTTFSNYFNYFPLFYFIFKNVSLNKIISFNLCSLNFLFTKFLGDRLFRPILLLRSLVSFLLKIF